MSTFEPATGPRQWHVVDASFSTIIPRQECPTCRAEHPGQPCPLDQDQLPLIGGD